MSERHREYLRRRRFDPDYLEKEYDLKGTGHLGRYAFRLIIPIYYEGKLISYEGRDITDQQDLRYKACPLDQEVIPRKHILYTIDKVPGKTVVVTEGVTDVWRLGPGAVATFGTGFTQEQLILVTKRFDRIILLFDPDDKAQEHAEYLAWQINSLGKEAIIYELEGVEDPGSMPQDDADAMMRDALK
jgi:DNA primase